MCIRDRNDIADLVPSVFKVLGIEAVHSLARHLEDAFTAGNVYVMLSYQLPDAPAKREQLLIAEKLAVSVRPGDRDYALRWVFGRLAQTFRGLRLESFQFQFEVYLLLPCPYTIGIIRQAIRSLSPPAFIDAPSCFAVRDWRVISSMCLGSCALK